MRNILGQNYQNAIFIGSLRIGGAEGAVRSLVGSLPDHRKERTRLVVANDPLAGGYARQLGVPIDNLNAGGMLSAAWKLRAYIRRHRIACVHAHLSQCIIAAGLACLQMPVRIVPYIHTFGSWKQLPRLSDRLKIAMERLVVNRLAASVVYVSHRTRYLHERQLGYRRDIGRVIPNPVASSFTNNPSDDGVLKLVSVGRVEKIKGFDWVLEQADFEDIFAGVKWTIVGSGGHRDALQRTAAKLGRDCVNFVGQQADVARYLADADVFFMPSLSEGLPMALLEACKSGLPLLATDVGSVGEVIRHGCNGLLLTVGDGPGLGQAIRELRSPATRREMGRQSQRIFCRKYDPHMIVRQVEALMV